MYTQSNVKRQKVTREVRSTESTDNFPGIGKVEYKADAPYNLENEIFYRYYNATERVHGRPMEDWLRPSIYIGRAFTPFYDCPIRPWNDQNQNIDNYKKGIRAAFELCLKLGIKFWSGFDTDLAPVGDTLEETNKNLEQVVELIHDYQQKTTIRPLWVGINFKETRYVNGAMTNSEATIATYAGFQIKRALDVANKLNAECFLLCGHQEGYWNMLNTDISREMKYFGRFLKLIVDQKERIGFRGQLLMQTVYDNPIPTYYHYYCADFFSTLTFLKHYNYDRYYKLNVKPGHEFNMANVYNTFGSIDIKQEHSNFLDAIVLLRTIVENGGMNAGGLNIYLPVHKSPFEAKDLIESFVVTLDVYAKALRIAVKLINDIQLNKSVQMRYVSFASGWGAKFLSLETKLDECEEQLNKQETNYNYQSAPSRSEHWTSVLIRYMEAPLM